MRFHCTSVYVSVCACVVQHGQAAFFVFGLNTNTKEKKNVSLCEIFHVNTLCSFMTKSSRRR